MTVVSPARDSVISKDNYINNYADYYFQRFDVTDYSELLSILKSHTGFIFDNPKRPSGQLGFSSRLKAHQTPRIKEFFNEKSNVIALDIEPNSALKKFIQNPLTTIEAVCDFIDTHIKLPSYIISRSWNSIEKPETHGDRWHVWFVFDYSFHVEQFKEFLMTALPKNSWYRVHSGIGKEVVNLFCDLKIYTKGRIFVEHPNAEYFVVDKGLCSYQSMHHRSRANIFEERVIIDAQTQEEIQQMKSSLSKNLNLSLTSKGLFDLTTVLHLPDGTPVTVQQILDNNKPLRLTAIHNMVEGKYNGDMSYDPKSQTFKDWTASSGGNYKISITQEETIEYTSKYLPKLNLTHDNTFILAPTGSGKTTAIKNADLGSTIFIAPRKAIVKDLDGMVSGLHGWDDIQKNQMNVMTFNKLAGHIEHNRDISEFTIVIDEIHTLFSDPTNAMYIKLFNQLILRQVTFKKLILLSATMEPEILPIKDLKSYKYINVSNKINIQFLKNVTEIDTLIKGTTLIFQQSKLLNASIYDRYCKTHRVLNLKSGSEIPKDLSMYDIIITTSVLREGFSITSKIDTVLLYNVRNAYGAYDIIQSIARPRANNPEIKIVSASTHFIENNLKIPTLASLSSAAEELALGYLPSELAVLQAINIEQFKRMCLTLDTVHEKVVVHQLGVLSYYLELKAAIELKDFTLMTKHLKEYLHCETSLTSMTEELSELPKLSTQELKTRLQSCKTFKELDEVIKILENAKDYAAQCQELLDSIENTVEYIDTSMGMLHLSEEQQVQYKVNKAMFSKVNQHKRNISEGVYATMNSNRAWRTGDKFTMGGLKKIFKILDPKKKSFTDDEVFNILRKVCRWKKILKDGTTVKRGPFDYIKIEHKTLIDLSAVNTNIKKIELAGI